MSVLMAVLTMLALVGGAQAQESRLLTDNGLTNEKYSNYGEAPRFPTGGWYEFTPAFARGVSETSPVTFAQGRLTNGDPSFDYKRDPNPYVYWQGTKRAELVVHLGRQCRIDRVRLCVLSGEDGPHGIDSVTVSVLGDPLEFPDVLKVGTIIPVANGWNELPVARESEGLRLVFAAAAGKSYITVSEIEVWGEPVGEGPAPASVTAGDPRRVEEGITWWAFDFGPKDSPSFAGFHVCHAHDVYSGQKGFGWIPYQGGQPATISNFGPASDEVPGLGERDRGGVASDPLFRDLLMVSAYYHTQVRQTFAVDVPAGRYLVMTFHGDLQYGRAGRQNFWIEAEGERVVDQVVLPAGLTTQVQFEVTVTDGQLDVTLDADHPDPARKGWFINGMVVLPVNDERERAFAERKREMILAALQRIKDEAFAANFVEVPYVETRQMISPTVEDTERGFIGWSPHWMDRIFPNSVPDQERAARGCAAFATPGEYEPVAVAMTTLREVKGVQVIVGDLSGPAGSIPASAIEVRKVSYGKYRVGSSWSKEWQTMPKMLERFERVDVPAQSTQEFWLTIHVPADAAPGTYRGPISIEGEGGSWRTTLTLEVFPFTLERNERPVGMYWHDERVSGELLDRQIRDMLAHGVTAVTMNLAPEFKNVDGRLVLDTTELTAFLRHLRELGIEGPIPYNPGIEGKVKRAVPDLPFEEAYVEAVRQLQEVSDRPDTPQLLFYPVDEIGNDEARGASANRQCQLIGRVPGAVSYITVNNYEAGEKWGDPFDIWCGNIEYTVEQEQRLLARGKRYMRYGPAYLNDARKARTCAGFGFYRRPAEAMYYWHYQAYNGDPFNDFDGTARDWCAAYPGPDGELIPTLDWEGIREGIDDMRYIATVKKLAARAQGGNAAQQAAAQAALAELDAVLGMDYGVNQYTYGERLSDEEFHNLRRRLADSIIRLLQVL